MLTTQIQKIIEELDTKGQISRNQCLRMYITRLGAYICDLNKLGWNIKGYYEKTEKGRDYRYMVCKKPKRLKRV